MSLTYTGVLRGELPLSSAGCDSEDGVDLYLELRRVRNSVGADQTEGLGVPRGELADNTIGRSHDSAVLVIEGGLESGGVLDRVVVGRLALDLGAVAGGYDRVVAERDLPR